jgi:CBS domain-containing protein
MSSKVNSVMNRNIAVCKKDQSLAEAVQIMWERDLGFIPVVDDARLLGVITDRDACMAAYTQDRPLAALSVEIAMAKKVFTCREDDDLSTAHELMRRHQLRRLPVVDASGRLVGVISLGDLALETRGRRPDGTHHAVALTLAEVSKARVTPTSLATRPVDDRGSRRKPSPSANA